MKTKILILLVLLSTLIGYLEWGTNQSAFLFQSEATVISEFIRDPASALHPFTVIPLLGQLLLFISLFRKRPNKYLIIAGLISVGILLVLIFLIGLSQFNYKMFLSVTPFLIFSFLLSREIKRK